MSKLVSESLNEWKDRVKRNTRKRLDKISGLNLTPEETDEYMNRYEDAHGVPMRSKKMAQNVEVSVYNDRGDIMKDIEEYGQVIVDAIENLGYKAKINGMGRNDGKFAAAIEVSDGYEYEFELDGENNIIAHGDFIGPYSGLSKDLEKGLEKILNQ